MDESGTRPNLVLIRGNSSTRDRGGDGLREEERFGSKERRAVVRRRAARAEKQRSSPH
jgi:hypothetical protein